MGGSSTESRSENDGKMRSLAMTLSFQLFCFSFCLLVYGTKVLSSVVLFMSLAISIICNRWLSSLYFSNSGLSPELALQLYPWMHCSLSRCASISTRPKVLSPFYTQDLTYYLLVLKVVSLLCSWHHHWLLFLITNLLICLNSASQHFWPLSCNHFSTMTSVQSALTSYLDYNWSHK